MKNQLSATSSGLLENCYAVFSLFALALAALTIIRSPAPMQFDVFAFSGPGANLTAAIARRARIPRARAAPGSPRFSSAKRGIA